MSKAVKKTFSADIEQLMELVTSSLYSNREIFLRELISNASDAHDKLRLLAMKFPKEFPSDNKPSIWIDYDKDTNILTIKDNGVGMTKEEVQEHLGTIAKSGTKAFLNEMKSADASQKSALIGQFGVGFYSAFVVADRADVHTLKAGQDPAEGVLWSSSGKGDYEIVGKKKDGHGTTISLTLKEDAKEFLDPWKLRQIIVRYSDHIGIPVFLKNEKKDTDNKDDANESHEPYERVNQEQAIWTMKNVEDKQYQDFYKYLTHDFDESLEWLHAHVEGRLAFNLLLYIPKRAPFDMWQKETKNGVKLYVQKVFIMDNVETFLPNYLRFVRGVVDSADLPLNVSREILQHNDVVNVMKQSCTKRVLDLLEKMADKEPEKFATFWSQFGPVLKEGPGEDFANRERILKICRFASTSTKEGESTSLDAYIGRMQKDQDKIYYLTAENAASAFSSPHLEMFRKKGIEVLVMSDRIDDWLMARVTEYGGKSFQSIAKADLDIKNDDVQESDQDKAQIEKVIKQMKEHLGEKVSEVKITNRLTDSPSCIVMGEQDIPAHLRKLFKDSGQPVPEFKPTLEVNAKHAMFRMLSDESSDEYFGYMAQLMLDQAILADGGELENPAAFVKLMNQVLSRSAG